MAKIILITHQKGGVGKTIRQTLACKRRRTPRPHPHRKSQTHQGKENQSRQTLAADLGRRDAV